MLKFVLKYFNLLPDPNTQHLKKHDIFVKRIVGIQKLNDYNLDFHSICLSTCEKMIIGTSIDYFSPVIFSLQNMDVRILKTEETTNSILTSDENYLVTNRTNEVCLYDIQQEKPILSIRFKLKEHPFYIFARQNQIYFVTYYGDTYLFNLENFIVEDWKINIFGDINTDIIANFTDNYVISHGRTKKMETKWRIFSLFDESFLDTDFLDEMTDVKISKDGKYILSINFENELFFFQHINDHSLCQIFKKKFDFNTHIEIIPTSNFDHVFVLNCEMDYIYCFSIDFCEIVFSFGIEDHIDSYSYKLPHMVTSNNELILQFSKRNIQMWKYEIPKDLRNSNILSIEPFNIKIKFR
eukprot:gene8317-141_t